MRLFPVLLLILLVLVPAASAESLFYSVNVLPTAHYVDQVDHGAFTYNAVPDGYVIGETRFYLNPSQNIDFIVTFNDYTTKTGHIYNGPTINTIEVSLDGETDTYPMPIPFPNLAQDSFILGLESFTENVTTTYNLSLYQTEYSRYNVIGPSVSIPLAVRPSENPWVSITVLPQTQAAKTTIGLMPGSQLVETEDLIEGGVIRWIDWLRSFITSVWESVMMFWGIFSFIFIENLLLTILLVEGTILAYHMCTAKNVFIAFSRIGQTNVYVAKFVFEMINYMIGYLHQIIDALKPV